MSSYSQPEVIINFADGFAYSKQRMEEVFKSGLFDKPPAKPPKEVYSVKKDDVELIMKEFEIPKIQAERALHAAGGDLAKALQNLVEPSKLA